METTVNLGLIEGGANRDRIAGAEAQGSDQAGRQGDGERIARLDYFLFVHN